MTIEQAIEKAIEGGWDHRKMITYHTKTFGTVSDPLLDPSFWRSLGKAMGWGICKACKTTHENVVCDYGSEFLDTSNWKERWHSLIDHLADGKSIEEYFEKL